MEPPRGGRDPEDREALFRSILNSMPSALIVVDGRGRIKQFSAAAARLFGYTAAEMTDRNLSTLLPAPDPDQRDASAPRYGQVEYGPRGDGPRGDGPRGDGPRGDGHRGDGHRGDGARGDGHIGDGHPEQRAGNGQFGRRFVIGFGRRKDASTFPVELSLFEPNPPGAPLHLAFVHDLSDDTERRRERLTADTELERLTRHLATARDAADRSVWARSRFLTGMSQELSTPLNGILSYAQLLRMEGELNAAQRKRIDAMLGAGAYLQQMITWMLDPSDIKDEQVELQAVELDVVAVASACLDLVRPAAEAKHLGLSMTVATGNRHTVITDPTRLWQVLLNLLGNAVKFTEQGSVEMRLRTVADESMLRISVIDSGPGLPAKERRRLFRDAERPDIEAARAAAGDGLGLALSARLATLMGGCLGHHDKPGGGSVFWLELPLDAAPEASPVLHQADEVAIAPAPSPTGLKVLVVDDVAMNRDIAASFLRPSGHSVTCVEGAVEAIAAVQATDFDVILMDVRMPEMDGHEATRRIRALGGRHQRVPIVALTAQAFPEQISGCREAGMDGHLAKPFDPESLSAAISRANDLRVSREQSQSHPAAMHEAEPADPGAPETVADLPVCNLAAFDRTTLYLEPETVAAYLKAIAERGEILLRRLRRGDPSLNWDELAEAAHTIAGSAGLFGFESLTALGRRFEHAVQTDGGEAPSLVDSLTAALEVTLHMIHDRALVAEDA